MLLEGESVSHLLRRDPELCLASFDQLVDEALGWHRPLDLGTWRAATVDSGISEALDILRRALSESAGMDEGPSLARETKLAYKRGHGAEDLLNALRPPPQRLQTRIA